MENNDSNDDSIMGGNGITAGGDVSLSGISAPVNIGNNYIHNYENIDESIKRLIGFAQFCETKKEYDKALEYYEDARVKLEKSPSKISQVKVIIGEAVCYHKKGNLSRAKTLIFEAKNVDPKNPIVLANIASYLKSENPKEAEIYAKEALELDQNNFLAKCVMGLLEYDKGNTTESLRILKQASSIKPNVGYPFSCMGYVYSHEEDYKNALKYEKEAVKIEPEEPFFCMELAIHYMNLAFTENGVWIHSEFKKNVTMEYVEKALECLEKAKEMSESQGNRYLNCEIYIHLSRVYLAKGKYNKSIEYCNLALDGGLDITEIYVILGEAYGGCQNYDKVIEHYEPLIKKDNLTGNNLFIVKVNLAVAYFFKNELNKAEKLLEKVIDENPENVNLYIQLSYVLEKKGDIDKAISTLNKIRETPQKPWDFYYMMGRLNHKNIDYESAVQNFKESILKNSEAIAPRMDLINLYIECNMYKYAIKQAKELVQLDLTGINYYNLASLYYEVHDYKESAFFASKALEANYDDVETHRLLCNSLLQANKVCEAKDEFENALKKYPDDLNLKLNYSIALSTLGDSEKAIEILTQIINNNPKCVFAYISMSKIYYKESSYEKALENAKKAVFIEQENEDAHFVIGCSLLKLGRNDEAVIEIQKVIEINPNSDCAWSVNAEEGIENLDYTITIFNNIIEKYEEGTITISKASEILIRDTFELLGCINNVKVAKSLSLSDEKIDKFRNSPVNKRDILVDETILGILAKIGSLDLLRKTFDHVYITKNLEDKIVTGPYLKDHPYREVKNELQVVGGWIESLIPSDTVINFIKKIIYKKELSKNDILFISLALDKDLLCLTEDLLLRIQLENINKSTCGIVGFINNAINKSLIKADDSGKILDEVKKLCMI